MVGSQGLDPTDQTDSQGTDAKTLIIAVIIHLLSASHSAASLILIHHPHNSMIQ